MKGNNMEDVDVKAIRSKLDDMSLVKVATKSDLTYLTVRKVRDGGNVTITTLRKLEKYFKGRGE
jgi:hypothetical protein